MLTVVGLAEASVEKKSVITSDKRERRPNKIDPPKTNSISVTLDLGKPSCWEGR
jgi:hypothetical protein